MKKFKQVFYLAYVLFFCFGGFIAINYENIVLKWDWDPIDTWAGLLRFVLKLGAFGLIMFFVEIVIENIHVFSLTKKVKSLENEVLDLKAKLYDKSETNIPTSNNDDLESGKNNESEEEKEG